MSACFHVHHRLVVTRVCVTVGPASQSRPQVSQMDRRTNGRTERWTDAQIRLAFYRLSPAMGPLPCLLQHLDRQGKGTAEYTV